ncbi:DUF2911 domain-containing protein [Kaistella flava (ex Peng et al. 2021)]|uniref:DUF2911 domain-containing protein n=1 Tax=Kaistella flava (ex Peng et al. 2021) TaxID=2038776 RepID=A0A7M2Y4X1_9FLAO|nr:DUF2911 domain-containing protein [Kaistella flava (ex Peng et al. 2021)]QOW09146.1 DUF2911 domain-containing protein [Kaistella flava (ex Peng et al. 2021)]
MKKLFVTVFLSLSVLGFSQFSVPTASPRQKVEQQFSMTKISVDYSRPGVKGRKVFGELVPYGKVWRAGANSATKITFEQNVNFGGKDLMAGTYGLFIVPTEKEWKVILNKDSQQWGAYTYDEKLNVVEVTVPVQKLSEKQEWFEIALNPIDIHSTDLVFKWDTTKVAVTVKEAKPEVVAKIIDKLNEIKQIEKDAAAKK